MSTGLGGNVPHTGAGLCVVELLPLPIEVDALEPQPLVPTQNDFFDGTVVHCKLDEEASLRESKRQLMYTTLSQ